MHPHCKQLHPSCSWSGNVPGSITCLSRCTVYRSSSMNTAERIASLDPVRLGSLTRLVHQSGVGSLAFPSVHGSHTSVKPGLDGAWLVQ